MTTNWRALCAELMQELESALDDIGLVNEPCVSLIDRARAALARGGHPAPVPVGEPIAWLWEYIGSDPYPHKFSPVARSLREMDPANPPFPDDWRPVAPLYALAQAEPDNLNRTTRRVFFNNPATIAECGGPCEEGGPEACDCGALWHDEPVADGPAVPEGREPASVAGEPSDEELAQAAKAAIHDYKYQTELVYFLDSDSFEYEPFLLALRAAIAADRARWGHQPAPPAAGEVER